jgi:hypothetical protein
MAERYIVVSKSMSCHCCFTATVMDTAQPERYNGICECFNIKDAQRIADALNKNQDQDQ